jgi:hypothetical protein
MSGPYLDQARIESELCMNEWLQLEAEGSAYVTTSIECCQNEPSS